MATIVDIKLKRASKVYREGDVLSGVVIIQSKSEVHHQGIVLSIDGTVNLQLSPKSVGLFEAFYNSVKPICLLQYLIDVAKPGKIPPGKTKLPFEVPLKPKMHRTLYETYHGVYVSIQYIIKAELKRSLLNKDIQKICEFIIEYKNDEERAVPKPQPVTISPDTLTNMKGNDKNIPDFKVTGMIDSLNLSITKPLTGELVVDYCETAIKSIEIQLVRVETCGCAEGYANEATEIQNIQLAEGDVCRNLSIPIYMIFPRLFTCPTLSTNNFKIEFEINIVVVFQDDYMVTANFPLKLTRF
ncbi:vacuolar protein sorting-associated protein 26C [Octopus bimaculoides]|uniref:Vacuolar protein sorting-associated protein 26C n=1 Tax=Octopus bimaculoides TaxID=37653 RepID=A0A0L8FHL3_OCTBM|nr:vacuolar protein sorting-associated protein 26C [Octopus bimaculoides]|eukprot:XP_014789907.1 PREDICTED: Down syndrome critical region protein 3 homolog [Octopus bimaculoides]